MRNRVIVSDVAHDWLLNPLSLLTRVPLRCLPLVHLSLVPDRLALRVTKSLRSLLLLSVSILVLLLHSAHSTVLILQPLRVEIYLMWLLLVHHKFTEPSHSTITWCHAILVVQLRVLLLMLEVVLLLDEIGSHHHVGVHLLLQSGHLHKFRLSGLMILHFLVKWGVIHRLRFLINHHVLVGLLIVTLLFKSLLMLLL
jgi:hypothetical protein